MQDTQSIRMRLLLQCWSDLWRRTGRSDAREDKFKKTRDSVAGANLRSLPAPDLHCHLASSRKVQFGLSHRRLDLPVNNAVRVRTKRSLQRQTYPKVCADQAFDTLPVHRSERFAAYLQVKRASRRDTLEWPVRIPPAQQQHFADEICPRYYLFLG